ncbi:VOC family protein [Candidatus Uhrbacteria bacterium]|nr:VOC family protein [Candidatus Uhrbacteria bacterium]
MIDHMTMSVSNLVQSKAFYDQALAPLGMHCLYEGEGYVGYGVTRPEFWIAQEEHVSKVHVAFSAKSEKEVQVFFDAAMDAGGTDNGKPGPRPEYHERYFGAFVLDPDGNNIEAVFGNS